MSPVVNTVRKTDARPDPSALVSFGPAGPHWVRSGRAIRLKNQRFDDFVFNFSKITGAPEEIRTPDPQIRSLVLYPAELRARGHRNGSGLAVSRSRRLDAFGHRGKT